MTEPENKIKNDNGKDGEIQVEEIDKAILDAEGERQGEETGATPSEKKEPDSEEIAKPQIDALNQQVKKYKKEAKEHHDDYLRTLADVENYKKRMKREQEEAHRYANAEFIKSILPVADNLERALMHGDGDTDVSALIEGVKMVYKQLIDTLGKFNVTQIEAIGKPFDPNFHEAMMQMETGDAPPNTIVAEIAKGYLLHDRLIRPAMVGVAVPPKDDAEEKKEGGSGEEPSKNTE